MADYKCWNCGEKTSEPKDSSGTIRCVKCGYKIFFKVRQPVARKVTSR